VGCAIAIKILKHAAGKSELVLEFNLWIFSSFTRVVHPGSSFGMKVKVLFHDLHQTGQDSFWNQDRTDMKLSNTIVGVNRQKRSRCMKDVQVHDIHPAQP
jgi:hypothetical protein